MSREKGQTVIETALMIILLFTLFFGIAEVARAWWLKSALSNAARVGVRVAIVTTGLTSSSGENVIISGDCTSPSAPVFTALCTASGVPQSATAAIVINTTGGSTANLDTGDTVRVDVSAQYETVFPGFKDFFEGVIIPDNLTLTSRAAMRYE